MNNKDNKILKYVQFLWHAKQNVLAIMQTTINCISNKRIGIKHFLHFFPLPIPLSLEESIHSV